jgi:hypothetical protein
MNTINRDTAERFARFLVEYVHKYHAAHSRRARIESLTLKVMEADLSELGDVDGLIKQITNEAWETHEVAKLINSIHYDYYAADVETEIASCGTDMTPHEAQEKNFGVGDVDGDVDHKQAIDITHEITGSPTSNVTSENTTSDVDHKQAIDTIALPNDPSDVDIESTSFSGLRSTLIQYQRHSDVDGDTTSATPDQEEGVRRLRAAQPQIPLFDGFSFGVQVWFNSTPSKGQSYWSVKLREATGVMSEEDAFEPSPLAEYALHFFTDGRRFRDNLSKYIRNKISPEFADLLHSESYQVKSKIAVMSRLLTPRGQKAPKGRSSREGEYVGDIWATLETSNNEPVRLDIRMGDEIRSITKFINQKGQPTKRGKPRSLRAAGWIGHYDPENTYAAIKQNQRNQKAAEQRHEALTKYNPKNALEKFIWNVVLAAQQPLLERINEQDIKVLELENMILDLEAVKELDK